MTRAYYLLAIVCPGRRLRWSSMLFALVARYHGACAVSSIFSIMVSTTRASGFALFLQSSAGGTWWKILGGVGILCHSWLLFELVFDHVAYALLEKGSNGRNKAWDIHKFFDHSLDKGVQLWPTVETMVASRPGLQRGSSLWLRSVQTKGRVLNAISDWTYPVLKTWQRVSSIKILDLPLFSARWAFSILNFSSTGISDLSS